ncbi:MAG TPA: alpha/beta hydrolase [Dehalococcoidia bacterium]|nr:alpha/beta hydrolase [Dehalococcoidia bacterium]
MAVSPQHFTQVEGLRLQFRLRGEGPPLLMLHGWGTSSLSFMGASLRIEKRFRTLVPDLPGFGFSEMPPEPWGAADYARTVASLLESAAFGPCDVLGHSFGGLVATALATSRPDLVNRLVLVASPVVRLPPAAGVRARNRTYVMVRRLATLLPPFRERILDWGRLRYGSEDYRNAGAMRPTMVRVLGENWLDALHSVKAPTLLIYGEKDEDVPLAVAHAAIEALPKGAELVVVPGAGHFPFLDDTDAFVEALSTFLLPAGARTDA